MGKWLYRIAMVAMIVAIAAASIYWILLQTNPETMDGPWLEVDGYPTGKGWLLYPNGGEGVSGVIEILWDTDKTSDLGPEDKIKIGYSHGVRGGDSIYGLGNWPYSADKFIHEDWEGCYCSDFEVIVEETPNTGKYLWNATEVLEQNVGEWYPYYIRIYGGRYMDASNRYFNITG